MTEDRAELIPYLCAKDAAAAMDFYKEAFGAKELFRLEGLFHGIQATLFAQQMAARAQLEELQRKGLPPGPQPGVSGDRPGTYL